MFCSNTSLAPAVIGSPQAHRGDQQGTPTS
jgi:hypothetical protein